VAGVAQSLVTHLAGFGVFWFHGSGDLRRAAADLVSAGRYDERCEM
jgi:hypothetical protein